MSHRVHVPGLAQRLLERLRGRQQRIVRAPIQAPLLLLSYPSGEDSVAGVLEDAYTHLLPSLPDRVSATYKNTLTLLPPMIVVLLRAFNPCGCLGHHHPAGTESRLARRLKADMGGGVGEIDLAYEAIRGWQPQPLSSLAAGDLHGRLAGMHMQAALLGVLLHEMEHLAHPDRGERQIRTSSNEFYAAVMDELVRQETGHRYGMSADGA